MTTRRSVLALVAKHDLNLQQMGVKIAFLHEDLHEEVYMQQPRGYIEKGKEELVCRLRKSLYGLKQAPREWYKKFHQFMLSQGYKRSDIDHCLYMRQAKDGSLLILILYVDDMLIASRQMAEILALKSKMAKVFDMKDMGEASHILGMRIHWERSSMIATRPDIAFAMGVVIRYMSNPCKKHWEAAKGIMKYLKHTKSMRICYGSQDLSV
ncbi:hypothetical protein L7F22_027932 [Adiantum nelumboides]|nr:hypothetical protein [Adiantum nelumboides]